ncbi:beta-ketoacyl-[acyl-carrier-protein] synthase family protein [Rhodococcus xishaensis]|uniref:Uncharacterized protein n=1 Tax=Rhodococcus xishaensis TaxID=2487364 RepID=A0A3S3CRR8_9NOCA|nr:hypothetical protein [Rhodococcus xishaensis]RVW04083.1 hypothetical protein EGT50_06255 [Rhodococcus xishaensis]
MGVVITATGASHNTDTASIVEHSSRAARAALTTAKVGPEEVGVLINTGTYRDSNTVEPAIAALIQKAAGIGLDYGETDPRSFSFDLMNGACGVLNAVQVASGLLETGTTARVLIVSGDTHPSMTGSGAPQDFPYTSAGAAMLLEHVDGPEGFGPVHVDLLDGASAVEGFVDSSTMGITGRSAMTVARDDGFEVRVLDAAVSAASAALGGAEVDPANTILISSRPTPDFQAALASKLGIRALDDAPEGPLSGDLHTAALTLAYHHAAAAGRIGDATSVLFVAAGSGPSAAAVVYQIPGRAA